MYTTPPRTLNAPTAVWFSCFTQTSAPVRAHNNGQRICGVGGITRCTRSAALSSSSRPGRVMPFTIPVRNPVTMLGRTPYSKNMQFTTLGKTGITVSRLCLGCMSYGGGPVPDWALGTRGWHVSKEDAREHFAIALEAGINFFDTADVYSAGQSEEITGFHLKQMAARDEIVLATKVHGVMGKSPNQRGLSRKHILQACDDSLRRLQM